MKSKNTRKIQILSLVSLITISSSMFVSCALKNVEIKRVTSVFPKKIEDTSSTEEKENSENSFFIKEDPAEKLKRESEALEKLKVDIENFKTSVNESEISFKPEALKAIDNFYLKPYSASFDKNNFKSYFKFDKLENFDLEVNNISISKEDINTTVFDLDVINHELKLKINKQFKYKFDNDIKLIADEVSKSDDFDYYFTYSQDAKSRFLAKEVFANENFSKVFTPKKIRYFDVKFKEINQSKNDSDVSLKLELYLHDKFIKEIIVNSNSWKGKAFFNLSQDKKALEELKWYIEQGVESLELHDVKTKAPTMFLPSKIDLNSVFKLSKFDGYELSLEKAKNNKHEEIINEIEGKLEFRFKVKNLKNNEIFYSKNHKMEFLKQEGDPENVEDFNDDYFTSKNSNISTDNTFIDLKNKVDKINGSSFSPRRVVNQTYIEPDKMTSKNLKYFLAFRIPNKGVNKDTNRPENINISDQEDTKIDINNIRKNYYFAFYNVHSTEPNDQNFNQTLNFKIGFINKKNPLIRYHSKLISLKGLKNTLSDKYYAIEDLSNITLENLHLENDLLSIKPSEFLNSFNKKDSNWSIYRNYIKVKYDEKLFNYKKYSLETVSYKKYISDFDIIDVKEADDRDGSVYVKLGYLNKEKAITWIRIKHFLNSNLKDSKKIDDFELIKKLHNDPYFQWINLMTVQRSRDEFLRYRKLEFKTSNGKWLANKDNTRIEFTIPKNYYEPVFENKNAIVKDQKFLLHLPIMYNNNIAKLWGTFAGISWWTWPKIIIDYNKLKNEREMIIEDQMRGAYQNGWPTTKPFYLKLRLTDKGIEIEVYPKDTTLKFTQKYYSDFGSYYKLKNIPEGALVKDKDVPKDKAIYFDTRGANILLMYTNNIANEVFDDVKSNEFDYDNVTFNKFDNTIFVKTKYKNISAFEYNFNQNVPQKWSSGYKTDYEVLPFESLTREAEDIKARTFASGGGSYTMLRKLNNDPNDYRYLAVTNQHIIGTTFEMWERPLMNPSKTRTTYFRIPFSRPRTDLYNSFADFKSPETVMDIPMDIFWSATSPIGKDLKNTRQKIDVGISVFDIRKIIKKARKESKFEVVSWLENWKNLKPLTFSYDYQDESVFFENLAVDYTIGVFPDGKPAHYLVNRINYGGGSKVRAKNNNITRIFTYFGVSGGGVINSRGEYVAAINSISSDSLYGDLITTMHYDYIGGNNDKNPFSKHEGFSVLAHMYRANLYDPRTFEFNKQMEVK
ncbi:MGA_1079 family surface serine endopeptidase [Mycoplasmopsis alligatoris]|uniref:Lipoprotein n=1 Tax=Mycoplasmopsis alligatoris A21JP2 TaxID=747682 RepID=D4XWT9_9BACT|nr:hypothetical protein [Mycoplasmopsis alligatoris]EFF41194.1 hypothetical protein MALL_0338 [Mycoplasmopsis alligatoris A21JP2]